MKRINITNLVNTYDSIVSAENDVKWYSDRIAHFAEADKKHEWIFAADMYARRQTEAEERVASEKERFEKLCEPLDAEIKKVEGKASARCVNSEQIAERVSDVVKNLKLAKNALNGCTLRLDINAQKFPRAYKYTPMSTAVSIEFSSGKIFVTRIDRDRCGVKEKVVTLTDDAKRRIIERACAAEL